mmetsp:Transcript_106880/g.212235  ORF Transcript_106880/g.212235 Transcript_106880/m.212235 type:complete len:233 (-) Transcript_106880:207-905(-)
MPVLNVNFRDSSKICEDNSRVGAKTRTQGIDLLVRPLSRGIGGGPARNRHSTAGTMNAQVLPEPVWAQAIRSRPLQTSGMECFCTGVGRSYPQRCRFLASGSLRSASRKRSILQFSSQFRPVTLTGILSYSSKLMPSLDLLSPKTAYSLSEFHPLTRRPSLRWNQSPSDPPKLPPPRPPPWPLSTPLPRKPPASSFRQSKRSRAAGITYGCGFALRMPPGPKLFGAALSPSP